LEQGRRLAKAGPVRILCPCTHSWLWAYKIGNILETVKDRAKVRPTINDLYKIVQELTIAAKMYDLQCPLSEIQGH